MLDYYLNTQKEEVFYQLEKLFIEHYKKALILSYFSKTIHYFAQNFDKKIKFDNNFYQYDIQNKSVYLPTDFGNLENIENDELEKAYNQLNQKQKKLLELYYGFNLTLTEISKIQNVTVQAVSKNKKFILNKIKKSINGEI